MMRANKRTISIGKLRTASLAYLSGFFGEVVTRGEMIMLQESASESGAKRIGSGAWNSFLREGTPIRGEPPERETFARDTVDMAAVSAGAMAGNASCSWRATLTACRSTCPCSAHWR